jgi:hypothetical protein
MGHTIRLGRQALSWHLLVKDAHPMDYDPQRASRRDFVRLLGGAALALPVALRFAGAEAARGWCRTDPTVAIAGLVAHLYVSGQVDVPYVVSGPTQIVFRVPIGISTAVLASDNSFGLGYAMRFVEDKGLNASAKEVQVVGSVYVPTTAAG